MAGFEVITYGRFWVIAEVKAMNGPECDAESMLVQPIPEEGRTVCLELTDAAYRLLTTYAIN